MSTENSNLGWWMLKDTHIKYTRIIARNSLEGERLVISYEAANESQVSNWKTELGKQFSIIEKQVKHSRTEDPLLNLAV